MDYIYIDDLVEISRNNEIIKYSVFRGYKDGSVIQHDTSTNVWTIDDKEVFVYSYDLREAKFNYFLFTRI